MAIQVILNQHAGPLPLTVPFNSPTDGPSTLVVSGSVWTSNIDHMIGIEISLDGERIGSASIFSNLATTHRAVVTAYIPLKLAFGAHKLTLSQGTPVTVSDYNDLFSVVLDY